MTADRDRLAELEAALAKGTADGEWRAVDNGTRYGPENRYEILDDEGSVAVCSDDNDTTASTGADRAALIVAAVSALPDLIAAVRAGLALADDLLTDARTLWALAETRESETDEVVGDTYFEASKHLRAALDPAAHHTEEENRG